MPSEPNEFPLKYAWRMITIERKTLIHLRISHYMLFIIIFSTFIRIFYYILLLVYIKQKYDTLNNVVQFTKFNYIVYQWYLTMIILINLNIIFLNLQ